MGRRIVINAGHGGTYGMGKSTPNNTLPPLCEKDLTLAIARRMPALLGDWVVLTRERDQNLTLGQRAKVAKELDAIAFVSLHFNQSADPQKQGTATWVHDQATSSSIELARRVQDSVARATGYPGRGLRWDELSVLSPGHLGQDTAACLLEVSYLTDPREAKRLRDPEYLDQLAAALALGIATFVDDPFRTAGSLGILDQVKQAITDKLIESARKLARQFHVEPLLEFLNCVYLLKTGKTWFEISDPTSRTVPDKREPAAIKKYIYDRFLAQEALQSIRRVSPEVADALAAFEGKRWDTIPFTKIISLLQPFLVRKFPALSKLLERLPVT